MSRRTEKLGSLMRNLLALAIRNRLHDPRVPLITSITRVTVSEDLSVARVYVSVMADATRRKLALDALRSAAGMLRREIAPELSVRKLPQLAFHLDDSVRRGFETVAAIDQAMRELGQKPEWERDDDPSTDGDEAPGPERGPETAGEPRRPAAQEDA